MINGDRVKQARELRGLTQVTFAKMIGVNQSAVAQIESGIITPREEVVQRIVLRTGFPLSFFKQASSTDFPLGSLLFRARASTTLKERCEARQFARAVFEVAEKMESNVEKIPLRLPRLDHDPIDGAIQTRSALGLPPDAPVDNLTNVIERNGVLVIALPIDLKKRDAFSVWVGSEGRRPVIIVSNPGAPGDRLRFNLAHELGHLVIHQSVKSEMSKVEAEANLFAAEFLMPKDSIVKEIAPPVTLIRLLSLKSRWKVSIQALIRRAFDVGVISQRRYRDLMYQLTIRKWRLKEPVNIPVEKPRMVGQMAELLYGVPINYKRLAADMNLPLQIVRETIEAHAIKSSSNNEADQARVRVIRFTPKKSSPADSTAGDLKY